MFRGLFQPLHLLVIMGIAFVVLGPKKIGQLGSGLGKSMHEFKKAFSNEKEDEVIDITPRREPEDKGKGRNA